MCVCFFYKYVKLLGTNISFILFNPISKSILFSFINKNFSIKINIRKCILIYIYIDIENK